MNHVFKRSTPIALALAGLLVTGSAFAQMPGQGDGPPRGGWQMMHERGCGWQHHRMGGGLPLLMLVQRHAYALKLTDKQASEIAVWRNQHLKTAVETRKAMREDFMALRKAALDGRDRSELDAIGARIDAARAKMLKLRIDQIELIKRVLTPEQWKQATDWAKRFEHRKMGHPGMPGHGPMAG